MSRLDDFLKDRCNRRLFQYRLRGERVRDAREAVLADVAPKFEPAKRSALVKYMTEETLLREDLLLVLNYLLAERDVLEELLAETPEEMAYIVASSAEITDKYLLEPYLIRKAFCDKGEERKNDQ